MVCDHCDEIMLSGGDEPVVLREAARMGETLAGSDGFCIDRSILPADVLDRHTTVLVQIEPSASLTAVEQGLSSAGAASVRTPAEISAAQGDVSDDENRAVRAALVGLGSVYALISALSTLALSIGQRRSELATLRLSGFTRRQVQRTTVTEALAATSIGLLLGAVAAVLTLVGLWAATARVYGAPVIAIPWTLLGAITVLAAALTVLTALMATHRAVSAPAVRALGGQE